MYEAETPLKRVTTLLVYGLQTSINKENILSDSGDLSYTVVCLWETMIEMETVAMSRMKVVAEGKLHPNYPFPVVAAFFFCPLNIH